MHVVAHRLSDRVVSVLEVSTSAMCRKSRKFWNPWYIVFVRLVQAPIENKTQRDKSVVVCKWWYEGKLANRRAVKQARND